MERKKIVLYLIVSAVIFILVFLPGFSELHKLREENANIKKRISYLQQHNSILKEEVRRMKEDPYYVEKKAREKLGIAKKGEYIYKGSAANDE